MVFLDVSRAPTPSLQLHHVMLIWALVESNLPCGAATLLLVFLSFNLRVRNVKNKLAFSDKAKSMDPIGVLLLLGAVCCLLLVLQEGGTSWPWKTGKTIGLLVVSIVLLVVFGLVQSALGDRATVPLRILKDRTVLAGSLFLAISNASSYVVGFDPVGAPAAWMTE